MALGICRAVESEDVGLLHQFVEHADISRPQHLLDGTGQLLAVVIGNLQSERASPVGHGLAYTAHTYDA